MLPRVRCSSGTGHAGPEGCVVHPRRRHKFFNTNNLWVNLDKLQSTLDEQGGLLKLPLIKNKKTVRN